MFCISCWTRFFLKNVMKCWCSKQSTYYRRIVIHQSKYIYIYIIFLSLLRDGDIFHEFSSSTYSYISSILLFIVDSHSLSVSNSILPLSSSPLSILENSLPMFFIVMIGRSQRLRLAAHKPSARQKINMFIAHFSSQSLPE